jgi:ATP-dependent protease ClpP protease subunit
MSQAVPFYTIRAKADERTAEVLIYGDIGESWWGESVTAKKFVQELDALDVDTLTIRINSPGGSVTEGIAIHNAIRRHKAASKPVVVDGVAASIAGLIAMAGTTVQMSDNAAFMVHAPWGYAMGNSAELREYADLLDFWAEAMSTSYARKTGKSKAEMLALLTDGKDHWYTAEEAKDMGFIDEVIDALPLVAGFDRAAISAKFKSLPVMPASTPAAAAAQPAHKETNMSGQPQPAAEPQAAEAIEKAALAKDTTRRNTIKGLVVGNIAKLDGVTDLIQAACDDTECTVEAARERLLTHMAKDVTPLQPYGAIVTVEDSADKIRDAVANALMARAAVPGIKAVDSSNPFRGMKLLDLARDCAERAGIRTRGMDQRAIIAAAFTQSTSDFPIILENTLHKTLQQAYAVAPDTWSRICAVGSVSDFRDHKRYRAGSIGNLDELNELGEFKTKAVPDGEKGTIAAGTKGNLINLSRETIINDDLSAFIGLGVNVGRAAKRTVEADFYALLALNSGLGPTMLDGNTLFHASHANIGSASALSMVAIDADRVVMGSQMDVGSNDFLDLTPAVLLVPLSQGGTARSINDAQYDPDTANKLQKPNVVRGLFRDIVDTARLSGNRRYLFADPNVAPVIECAFLDGMQTPYVESKDGWDVDGTQWKVRLDYGFAAIDYRGAVTNAGA